METIINNIKFSYEDVGNGFPVVFIHGFPLNKNIWRSQMEGLSDKLRVITLDLRGFGESQATNDEYSMDLFAFDIANFFDHLNIIAPVLVGLSMGGYIALAFCQKYAKWLSGLCLVSTRATPDTEEGKANRDKLASIAKDQGIEALVNLLISKMVSPTTLKNKPELLQELKTIMLNSSLEGVIGSLQAMKNRPDYSSILPYLNLPTLIIHGKDDVLASVAESEKMAQMIPESRLEVISDAGHMVNMEQPESFNSILSDFINIL